MEKTLRRNKYKRIFKVTGWVIIVYLIVNISYVFFFNSKMPDKVAEQALYQDIANYPNRLSDKIKLEKRYFFEYNNGEPKKVGELLGIKEYDSLGNIILENKNQYSYDSLSRLKMVIKPNIHGGYDTVIHEYEQNDLLISKTEITPEYTRKIYFSYDSLKNKIRQYSYLNDSIDWEFIYNYDFSSKLISQEYTNFKERKKSRKIYEYKGNTRTLYEYTSDGGLLHKIIFKYDSSGNEIEQAIINKVGETQSLNLNEFNSEGKKTKYINYSYGKKSNEQVWRYDSIGNLIVAIDYYGYGPLREIKYIYDTDNKLKEKRVYDCKTHEILGVELIVYDFFE